MVLITHDYRMKEVQLLDKYVPVIKMISRQEKVGIDENFLKNLEEIDYTLFLDTVKINAITYNPETKVLVEKNHPKSNDVFRILNLESKNYIYIKKRNDTLLIRDNSDSSSNSQLYITLVFSILLITIILVYLITIPLTIFFSAISYEYFEKYFLKLKRSYV